MLTNTRPLTNRMKRMLDGRRWALSTGFALLAVLMLSGSIFAGGWCRADPIVAINDEEIQVWVAIPEHMQQAVNGPIDVEFSRPWDGDARVVYLDEGFNGHGERVSFFSGSRARPDGSFDVKVFVKVPIDSSKLPDGVWTVPVQLEIVTDNGTTFVEGNHWWTSATVTAGG